MGTILLDNFETAVIESNNIYNNNILRIEYFLFHFYFGSQKRIIYNNNILRVEYFLFHFYFGSQKRIWHKKNLIRRFG